MNSKRLIVALTGATGTAIGVRLLERLQNTQIETHLVVSKWAARTLTFETSYTLEQVRRLATYHHSSTDQGAVISSGSFLTSGMVIVPCSVRTLSAIATGAGDNLIHRAADVILKERRKLALVVRESPLHEIHLENMLKLARMGAVIMPPVPAFYNHPNTLEDLINHIVGRILDQFEIHLGGVKRWEGMKEKRGQST